MADTAQISHEIYDAIRRARTAKGLGQDEVAQALGVPQPRIAEMEARLRDGRLTKQMSLVIQAAAAVGLVPMFVPATSAARISAVVDDVQAEEVGSVWDELFVDLGDEPSPAMSP